MSLERPGTCEGKSRQPWASCLPVVSSAVVLGFVFGILGFQDDLGYDLKGPVGSVWWSK